MMRHVSAAFAALAISLILTTPSMAAPNIRLVRVASGLSSPVFVTNAHDGTNRLFIVEQGGIIKVLQPNSTTPTIFLDISGEISTGGERGLLGLAFHPNYATDGRFYVNYTRKDDGDTVGDTVIAQYQVSADSDVAAITGTVLLRIPHSNPSHYAGMMDFGRDGYLYISTGDGDSSSDSDNSAQDIHQLLGKILRIDVDNPILAMPYSSPATNPFYGNDTNEGADEIYAYGFRNPWRFSIDRGTDIVPTNILYVADVGQASREEVDIVTPGNYGWRVWEGTNCTGLTPQAGCTGDGYTFPVIEYTHKLGRCSITGGYVYRGTQGSLPVGSYVFGDYCTGEIFQVRNSVFSVLLDTTFNISSFGEDEAGEVYVVNLNGTIDQIANIACTYAIIPTSANVGTAGGTGAVDVTASAGCPWTAISNDSWIEVTADSRGSGTGAVDYSFDLYPDTIKRRSRTGTITIAGKTFTVKQSR